jgi:hypothetical protein
MRNKLWIAVITCLGYCVIAHASQRPAGENRPREGLDCSGGRAGALGMIGTLAVYVEGVGPTGTESGQGRPVPELGWTLRDWLQRRPVT